MSDSGQNKNSNVPNSTITDNTYKDFSKICRAYYNELMHLSKSQTPSLSKEDLIVIDDLIKEVYTYSNELIKGNFITEARQLIDIGLVIIDFLLKIFGSMPSLSKFNNLAEKLSYPLSKKLMLLEANFNILFRYDRDYVKGEKNLEEIFEIQKYLSSPLYNLASSRFYMAVLKFYQNDIEKSEQFANEALDLLERKSDKEKVKESATSENRKTRKISNILEFLAELHGLKKDYPKVIACYEKAYYLNLGRFGGQNVNTEYFKTKLEIANDEVKKYGSSTPQSQSGTYQTPTAANQFGGSGTKSTNGYNYNIDNSAANSIYNQSNLSQNILHKGRADTFSFKIPTSNLYEPLLIAIYELSDDDSKRYSPELFVCNLCFDKLKLLRFLDEEEGNNAVFYTDESLNKILCSISLLNGYVSFLDPGLKIALINSGSLGGSAVSRKKK